MPKLYERYIRTWRDYNPDWDHMLWTDKNLPTLQNQRLFNDAKGIVQKADLLRMEVVYQYGGIYVDTDFECYKNMNNILIDVDFFATGEKLGVIGNAIFGAIKHSPILLRLIKNARQSIKENKQYGPNIKTGPVYFTRNISLDEVTYYPPEMFYPILAGYEIPLGSGHLFPDAYANHHFGGSWVGNEEPISGYAPNDYRRIVRKNANDFNNHSL